MFFVTFNRGTLSIYCVWRLKTYNGKPNMDCINNCSHFYPVDIIKGDEINHILCMQ